MAFCSALAFVLVRVTRVVKSENMTKDVYPRKIVPIGFLFSLVLWLGNSAYVYLSVSFIQMVKALMPCVVYIVAVAYQVETFRARVMFNMLIISFGVAVASYGNFASVFFRNVAGFHTLRGHQVSQYTTLLTAADIRLNSVTTLYYVSPACFVFLSVPLCCLSYPQSLTSEDTNFDIVVLLSNATWHPPSTCQYTC